MYTGSSQQGCYPSQSFRKCDLGPTTKSGQLLQVGSRKEVEFWQRRGKNQIGDCISSNKYCINYRNLNTPVTCFLILLLRLSPIVLTVTNTISACLFDFCVGQINLGTFGVALTSCFSGCSRSLMPFSRSESDSMSAPQSSSLLFGLSKATFKCSRSSVSEMLSCGRSLSLLTGWQLILLIRWSFNTWVRPQGRSFADQAGGKGDYSDNLNAASPPCWNSDHDALTISSIAEMYPTAVICLYCRPDSFCVPHRFWLPSDISRK